jgi:hypothetical protein
MAEIPDDVVERALLVKRNYGFKRMKVLHDKDAPANFSAGEIDDMRAALRVGVEWAMKIERDRNAEMLSKISAHLYSGEPMTITISSPHTNPDDCNPSDYT